MRFIISKRGVCDKKVHLEHQTFFRRGGGGGGGGRERLGIGDGVHRTGSEWGQEVLVAL